MTKKILFCALAALLCLSCAKKSLPERMDSFVDKVEATADKKSEADWEKTTKQYEALLTEFKENYNSYTNEEKKSVFESIGRYNAVLVKKGLEDLKQDVDGFLSGLQLQLNQIPDALNGLLNGGKE